MPRTHQHSLAGRTAIVTGAGRNIGRSIAVALAAEGAEVMLLGRSVIPLRSTVAAIEAAGGQAVAFPADITSPDDVSRAVEDAMGRWGRIDVLVNNAGTFDEPSFFDLDRDTARGIFEVNVMGTLLMSQEVARHMASARRGSIVHISSIDAAGADGNLTAYPASKAAVLSLGRTMAVALAGDGVRVNCVSPGWVHTEVAHQLPGNVLDHMVSAFARVPMGRFVEPEEVADAVVFLASDSSSGITGTNIVVDGGLTANLYVEETLPEGSS